MEQLLWNAIFSSSIYILTGLGFSLIYSVTRVLNFAYGVFYCIAAYCFYYLYEINKLPVTISFLLAIFFSFLFGGCVEYLLRPLRNAYSSSLPQLLASFSLLIIFQATVALFFGEENLIIDFLLKDGALELGEAIITFPQLLIIFLVVLSIGFFLLIIYSTRFGLMLRAVADNPSLFSTLGNDLNKVYLLTLLLGASLAGVGGVLVSFHTTAYPTMGFYAVLYSIAVVVIGGIGSIQGIFLGGILVGFAKELAAWYLPTTWNNSIVFLILLAFLLIRPRGFLGKPIKRVEL